MPDPRPAEVVAATAGTPLTPSDPARLGAYTVLRRLGKGGMGVVYLARTDSWRLVAIKVIRSDIADDPAFRTRFRREAATAQKVARFCTAEVLDADPDAEQPYLVTEYVDGPNLDEAVTSAGPLAPANLERLAVGVAAALSAIHSAGVVHRDLKPANVLMSQFGPRVVDFGIARSADATRLSMDVRGMGTPAFMAPEQARGEAATPAADIFAWGGVVAFAGTGRFVFGKDDPGAVIYRAAHEQPDLTGLDPELRDLVERALSKDQADRPTASELLADLLGSPPAEQPAAVTRVLHDWAPVPLRAAAAPPGEPPDDDHRRKTGGHIPPEPEHGAGRRLSKRLLALVATLGVLVAAALVVFIVLSLTSPDQAAATVTRDPVFDAGPNPFLPPVGTDQRDVRPPPDSGGMHSGGTQGLYGGTPDTPSCDSARMENLFRESPDKETAWANTLGVKQQDVSSYLQTLTPVVLRTDTAVTNHRYVGNRAVPIPAVLQAGTAVLVDQFGTPVTKCYCGNPLTKPPATSNRTYVGPEWPGFSPEQVVVVQPTSAAIKDFTLVDLSTGRPFFRPAQTTGDSDRPYTPSPSLSPGGPSEQPSMLPPTPTEGSPGGSPTEQPPPPGRPETGTTPAEPATESPRREESPPPTLEQPPPTEQPPPPHTEAPPPAPPAS